MNYPKVYHDQIDLDVYSLYHVSPNVFDFPDYDKIAPFVIANDKSPNGVLGLWISPFPDACSSFGPHVYDVTIAEDYRGSVLDLSDLRAMHCYHSNEEWPIVDRVAYYQGYRTELLKTTDVLFIGDANGGVGEVIVLNFDVITSFTKSKYVLK